MENFMKKIIFGFAAIALLFALSSCKTVNVTGNNIKDTDIKYLQNHQLTKDQVIEHIGTPTIAPDYSPNTWYYAYIKTTKTTWTFPTIVEQKLLKVTFDSNDKVNKVTVIDNTYNNDVKSISTVTPTPGTEESPLQEFVKNIGRFNKSKKKK